MLLRSSYKRIYLFLLIFSLLLLLLFLLSIAQHKSRRRTKFLYWTPIFPPSPQKGDNMIWLKEIVTWLLEGDLLRLCLRGHRVTKTKKRNHSRRQECLFTRVVNVLWVTARKLEHKQPSLKTATSVTSSLLCLSACVSFISLVTCASILKVSKPREKKFTTLLRRRFIYTVVWCCGERV